MKVIRSFGFDPGTARDVGELFLLETAKTLVNGSCPGYHNAIVVHIDAGGGNESPVDLTHRPKNIREKEHEDICREEVLRVARR